LNQTDRPIWWKSEAGGWRPLPPYKITPGDVDADGWCPGDRNPGDPIWKVGDGRIGGPLPGGNPKPGVDEKVPEDEFGKGGNRAPKGKPEEWRPKE
jgi:hypothetical protein